MPIVGGDNRPVMPTLFVTSRTLFVYEYGVLIKRSGDGCIVPHENELIAVINKSQLEIAGVRDGNVSSYRYVENGFLGVFNVMGTRRDKIAS